MRQRERVLLHAQPLPRRGAAGGNGAWLPVPLFNQFPQSTRLKYGAICVADFAESTGSYGLSVSRPGLMHLARDADPFQRQLLGPFASESSRSPEAYRAFRQSVSVETIGGIYRNFWRISTSLEISRQAC